MIITGWKVKPIEVLNLNRQELKIVCKKHNIPHRLIIGKKYHTLYFIPLDYFFAKERASCS